MYIYFDQRQTSKVFGFNIAIGIVAVGSFSCSYLLKPSVKGIFRTISLSSVDVFQTDVWVTSLCKDIKDRSFRHSHRSVCP